MSGAHRASPQTRATRAARRRQPLGKCEEAVPDAAAAAFLGQFCPLDHPQRRDWGAVRILHTKFLGCLSGMERAIGRRCTAQAKCRRKAFKESRNQRLHKSLQSCRASCTIPLCSSASRPASPSAFAFAVRHTPFSPRLAPAQLPDIFKTHTGSQAQDAGFNCNCLRSLRVLLCSWLWLHVSRLVESYLHADAFG